MVGGILKTNIITAIPECDEAAVEMFMLLMLGKSKWNKQAPQEDAKDSYNIQMWLSESHGSRKRKWVINKFVILKYHLDTLKNTHGLAR